MLLHAHPDLDELLEDPPADAVAEHLAACPRCRIDRRLALRSQLTEHTDLPGLHAARARLSEARREATLSMTMSLGTATEPVLTRGTRLGPYVVEAWVGRGGMGSVFRVRDTRDDTLHALKVLSRVGGGAEQRLVRERLAQRSVAHTNVVRVSDSLDVNGSPALILDYVAGPTLHDWLREHGAPALEVADALAEGIMRGLFAVHASGFVHRDLKPRNILLEPRVEASGGVVPRIADFGLVRAVEAPAAGRLTRSGMSLGTPGYMAPEQARDAHRATVRSDVFSLGAVLYELLTGERAFRGGTLLDSMERALRQAYEPLPDTVPDRMRGTITRALQPDPEDRFVDVAAMLLAWRGLSR